MFFFVIMKANGFLIAFLLYLHCINCGCPFEGNIAFYGNCSKYYQCDHGIVDRKECPGGLHWNKDLKECDSPERANCGTEAVNVCLTPGCVHSAANAYERMGLNVDPCDDFYQFACGNFITDTIIPDDKTSVDMFTIINNKLNDQLRALIEEKIDLNDSKPLNMAKQLYEACMNEDVITEQGLKPLLNITNKLGGWPVVKGDQWDLEWKLKWNWQWAVKKMRKYGFGTNYIFSLSIENNLNNSTSRMIYVDQSETGLSTEYLSKGFDDKIVRAYYEYMVDIAIIFGANRHRAEQELREVVEFEIKLANISVPQNKRRNHTALYIPYSLIDMRKIYPYIQWVKYINALLPTELSVHKDEVIMVGLPSFFSGLDNLLNNTDNRIIANYMIWRVTFYSINYLSNELRQRQQVFNQAVSGTTAQVLRWEECIGVARKSFSEVVGAFYVRKYFHRESKSVAMQMVKSIREEFKTMLKDVKWMGSLTRRTAKEKLHAMFTHIGYPDELMDDSQIENLYEHLNIDRKSYLESVLSVNIFRTDLKFDRLRKPVNKTDWVDGIMPAVVNAYYHSIENSIHFPAGILQGQFFSADRPRYLNYGAIGSIIGHVLTHAFDDQGSKFDLNGNSVDWWKRKTKESYIEKAQCIINQYGNYTETTTSLKVNGVNTQGENIADNGGIKLSYLAYKKWVQKNGPEKKLPGLLQFTPQQMFWISAAQNWCSVTRPESMKQRISTNSHSPNEFRVKGPLSNLKQFAEDFNCPRGSPMNPVHKCEIW